MSFSFRVINYEFFHNYKHNNIDINTLSKNYWFTSLYIQSRTKQNDES